MDLKDIQFRVGLILAVMILAGVFTTAILMGMDSDREEDLQDYGDLIGEAITSASSTGDEFDMLLEVKGVGMNVPDGLKIRVENSLIILEGDGTRAVASTWENIIPTPEVKGCNITMIREIGRNAGGYVVRAPVELEIRGRNIGGERFVFVSVGSGDTLGRYQEMISFVNEELPASPGYSTSMDQFVNDTMRLENGVIYMDQGDVEEGSCPLPVVLGDDFVVEDMEIPVGSTLHIDRMVLHTEESILFDSRISCI